MPRTGLRHAWMGVLVAAAVAGRSCDASETEPGLDSDESELQSRASFETLYINAALDNNGGVATSSGAYPTQPVWTINDGRRGSPYAASIAQYAYWASSTTATVYNCNYG